MTLVVRLEPELFQVRLYSLYYHANNSSKMDCGSNADRERYFYPATEYFLEDTLTRSSLYHKVPYYQVSSDTPNRNYEARVTSRIPLYHCGGHVKAVVYYQRAELLYSYCGTTRNVDARSIGIVLSLFWGDKGRISSILSS